MSGQKPAGPFQPGRMCFDESMTWRPVDHPETSSWRLVFGQRVCRVVSTAAAAPVCDARRDRRHGRRRSHCVVNARPIGASPGRRPGGLQPSPGLLEAFARFMARATESLVRHAAGRFGDASSSKERVQPVDARARPPSSRRRAGHATTVAEGARRGPSPTGRRPFVMWGLQTSTCSP